MEWVLSHMGDSDFDEPMPASSSSHSQQQSSQKPADPEQVAMLAAMGFTPEQVLPPAFVGELGFRIQVCVSSVCHATDPIALLLPSFTRRHQHVLRISGAGCHAAGSYGFTLEQLILA